MYTNAINAILVGAALIAGVTFQGFLQAPQDQSFILVFCVYNSLSFYAAVATMITGAAAALPAEPHNSIEKEVLIMRKWVRACSLLLAVSTTCVLGAVPGPDYGHPPNVTRNRVVSTVKCVGLFLCAVAMTAYVLRGRFLQIAAETCSSNYGKLSLDWKSLQQLLALVKLPTIGTVLSLCWGVGVLFLCGLIYALFLALLFFLPFYGKFPGEWHAPAPLSD